VVPGFRQLPLLHNLDATEKNRRFGRSGELKSVQQINRKAHQEKKHD